MTLLQSLKNGWPIIKQQAIEYWKISLVVLCIFVFVFGFTFGTFFTSIGLMSPVIVRMMTDQPIDLQCVRSLLDGTYTIHIDDLVRGCVWPTPSEAYCNLTYCGYTVRTKVYGIQCMVSSVNSPYNHITSSISDETNHTISNNTVADIIILDENETAFVENVSG